MKKFYTTSKFKKRNQKKSLDAIKKYKKRKEKKYTYVESKSKKDRKKGKYYNTVERKPKIIPLSAPADFSLINNTEKTISYFNLAQNTIKSNNGILFDISKITTLTTDAIAVQIAKIKDERFHLNQRILGNEPDDEDLKKLFTQSGFYEYVNTTNKHPKNDKKLLIHEITNNRVEPDIAKEACLIGLKYTFKNEEIFEPLYDILIEIMQNTNNHAGNTRGKYDWWLHVYNHLDSSKTSYTFLDLGVGIFESLPVKSFKRDVLELIGLTSNLDLVPKLFAGEIKSRTARPERGKGIPQVFECSQDPVFDKFILISNDIYADLKTKENKIIKTPFNGTLFYWEINNNQNEN
ncbi:hypothetical protein [Flavobacterium xueshanense]|uniref:Uncharacterized protein n=1 Tax=Flavobacterium xueshanense TaxID=935223 RepID=A0A1I2HEH9_9FLAO|nr:hypothetical protein [Flavobacterium xueshanense]SFF27327.1 hypothetical protein SAMN04488131_11370 [Flavobacterium xueshanense]